MRDVVTIDKDEYIRHLKSQLRLVETLYKELYNAQDEIRVLRTYKERFTHALKEVGSVFQPGGLLPDFCKCGDDIFEAVPKLAKEYLRSKYV